MLQEAGSPFTSRHVSTGRLATYTQHGTYQHGPPTRLLAEQNVSPVVVHERLLLISHVSHHLHALLASMNPDDADVERRSQLVREKRVKFEQHPVF